MLSILIVLKHLANGFNTFFIKGKPVFSNDPKGLTKHYPDYPILSKWVFDNFILADELFTKALRKFKTCALVNNNLCGKLVSLLESPTNLMKDLRYFSTIFYFWF